MSDKNILDKIFDDACDEFDQIEKKWIIPLFIVLIGAVIASVLFCFISKTFYGWILIAPVWILTILAFQIQRLSEPLREMKVVLRILKHINYEMEQSKKQKVSKVQ